MKAQTLAVDVYQSETNAISEREHTYDEEPFTISTDGHYVGEDGYVVPANFAEFYASQPKYVRRWASKWLRKAEDSDEVQDWEQDLLLYLHYLPEKSKARKPNDRHPNGCTDVIQCFDPYRQFGANQGRFRAFVNICLHNRSLSLVERMRKNPDCRRDNLAFGLKSDSADDAVTADDEYIHCHSGTLERKSQREASNMEKRLLVTGFMSFVRDKEPQVYDTLLAIAETRTFGDAKAILRMDESTFNRDRRRILQLKEAFEDGGPIRKQRKPYKKRDARGRVGITTA
jgi:hypothetical protein